MKQLLFKRRLTIFQRFLLTYLTIFIFCFIIISFLFAYTGFHSFQDLVVSTNTAILEEVKSETEERLKSIENSARKIGLDPKSTPFQMRRNISGMHILKMMNSDKQNNRLIEEIILYYPDVPWVYSLDGTASVEYMFNQKLNLNDQDQRRLLNGTQLTKANTPYLLRSIEINNEETNALIYPIPLNSSNPYGSAIYILDNQYIDTVTNTVFGEYTGNLFIFDSNEQLISHTSKDDTLAWGDLSDINLYHEGIARRKINDEEYLILTVQSEAADWTFASVASIDQFFLLVKEAWLKASVLLVIIFITGIVISLIITKTQYKPFEKIKWTLSKGILTKKTPEEEFYIPSINSFEDIHQSIENMQFNQHLLREKVSLQNEWRRNQVLFQLLEGKTIKEEDSLELIPHIKDMESGMVLMISFNSIKFNGESLYSYEKLSQSLHEFSLDDYHFYGLELPEKKSFSLISTTRKKFSQESIDERQRISSKVFQLIETNSQLNPTLGVGMFTDRMERLYLSFLESEIALEKKGDSSEEKITLFSKQKATDTYDFQIGQELLKLQRSLNQGKPIGAKKISSAILLKLIQNEENAVYFKLMCADLTNTVLKVAHNYDVSLNHYNLNNLYEISSINEYEKNLYGLIDRISMKVKEEHSSRQKEENIEIIQYIKNHYTEVSFGVEQVAEALNISNSYVSKSVKDETKLTFSRFLWQLRKEKVKEQLITTNKTIKDIVLEVGYIDGSNFSRKFKQEEGLTPSEYRNIHSNLVKV